MTLDYFNDLIENLDCNWPMRDWTLSHDYDDEWWLEIKHVDYHRFIREGNQTMIKVEHDDGRTIWFPMGNNEFSCSYNHNHDKMLCLIIKKEIKDEINNN